MDDVLINNAQRITVDQAEHLINDHLVKGAIASGNHTGADKVYINIGWHEVR